MEEQTKEQLEAQHYDVQTNEETNKISKEDEDWIAREVKAIEANSFDGERLEAFKPVENKAEEIVVDISKEWQKWVDAESGTVKKMIPVTHKGVNKLFWLNTKNPCYALMINKALEARNDSKTTFTTTVLRTGQKQNTRYVLVE